MVTKAEDSKLSQYLEQIGGKDKLSQVVQIIRRDRAQSEPLFGTFLTLKEHGLWPGGPESYGNYDFPLLTHLAAVAENQNNRGI